MHARRAPARIGETHPADQISQIWRHGGATISCTTLPSPVPPKALAVRSDDGLGFHNAQGRAPIGPNYREPNPEKAVARLQSQTTVLAQALQQEKLMTECKVLSLQSGPSLQAATKG